MGVGDWGCGFSSEGFGVRIDGCGFRCRGLQSTWMWV